ncbi:hypothetical protein [Marinobacterium jannaschii]|uniref:hypothetical protein n=1 Tax=Marinobacterium jannaschii TaxID=64970 RepID=UPI0004810EFA|nr:hypothetical protein [Marinobacterium jannaschii]
MKNLLIAIALMMSAASAWATPKVIHLDEYNGYFAAEETLAGLEPGEYTFVVTNKAKKVVGFLLQDAKTHERLEMFPLEPGESRSTTVEISSNGFRYRCPINPTPWYDVSVK